MENQNVNEIEQEIFEAIKNNVKNLPRKEVDKIIEGEIRKRNYLSENWQVKYATERIEEELKSFQTQEKAKEDNRKAEIQVEKLRKALQNNKLFNSLKLSFFCLCQ